MEFLLVLYFNTESLLGPKHLIILERACRWVEANLKNDTDQQAKYKTLCRMMSHRKSQNSAEMVAAGDSDTREMIAKAEEGDEVSGHSKRLKTRKGKSKKSRANNKQMGNVNSKATNIQ
jgi:hypothetical protein